MPGAIRQTATPDDFGISEDDVVHAQSGLLLPDKYSRTFHPQENLAIIRTMDTVVAGENKRPAATTALIGCPASTGPTSHAGEHKTCCAGDPKLGNAKHTVNDGDAAIKNLCLKHQDETVGIDDGILESVPNGDGKSSTIFLRASLDTESPCQKFANLGKRNVFDCSNGLADLMNDCESCVCVSCRMHVGSST